jgi:selenocysteine-specific elongation factor
MPKAELVRRLLPARARLAGLADFHLGWLQARKSIAVDGDKVTLPGRKAELSAGESGLAAAIVAEYEKAGLEPPSPAEVARRLSAKPEIVDGLAKHLVSRGRLARLPGALLISTAALQRLASDLRATGWEKFRPCSRSVRLSRKWAIPLLEQLDSIGVTRRAGDLRILPSAAPKAEPKA